VEVFLFVRDIFVLLIEQLLLHFGISLFRILTISLGPLRMAVRIQDDSHTLHRSHVDFVAD
jgi:hypothetical protein